MELNDAMKAARDKGTAPAQSLKFWGMTNSFRKYKRDINVAVITTGVVLCGSVLGGGAINIVAAGWRLAFYRNTADIGIKFDNPDEALQRLKYKAPSVQLDVLKQAAAIAVENWFNKKSPVVTITLPAEPSDKMTPQNIITPPAP